MKFIEKNKNVLFILIVALGLRLIGINQSFWLDEAAQAIESSRPLSQQFNIIPDFQPPLFHLIVHTLTYIGKAEWWLRLASLIPGLITIFFTYKIGMLIKNQQVGILASLLLATSQYHLFYSQELRPYSLAAMWGVVSTYALLQLMKHPKKKWWYRFTLSSIGGLFSMYVYPFLLISQILFLWWYRRELVSKLYISVAAMCLAFLPWLPTFIKQFQAGMSLKTIVPGWGEVVSLPAIKSLPLTLAKFIGGRIPVDMTLDSLMPLGLGLILGLLAVLGGGKQKPMSKVLLLTTLPILLAFIISFWVPVLEPKRLLFCLPLLYVSLAIGITQLPKQQWVLSGFLLINLFGIFRYATDLDLQREPWREAINEITTEAVNTDYYVFAFPDPFAPWQWYADDQYQTITPETLRVTETTDLDKHFKPLRLANQVIVFDYLMDLTDPDRRIYDWLYAHDYSEIGAWHYANMGFVRVFSTNTFAYNFSPGTFRPGTGE